MTKRRLLIIEDERAILDGLVDLFVFHGYEVDSANDGKLGLDKACTGQYDLIILDVMLPTMDGFAVCNEIRSKDRTTPIVMLTAKTSEEDMITGLSLGADDYVAKPFSIRALVLRVEAILRRSLGDATSDRYLKLGDTLFIDSANLVSVTRDLAQINDALEFTRREVEILRYLIKHSDRPVHRAELLEEIWGYKRATEIETRTVDIHVAKLRKKIEPDAKNPTYLATVRGEGYKLNLGSFVGRN